MPTKVEDQVPALVGSGGTDLGEGVQPADAPKVEHIVAIFSGRLVRIEICDHVSPEPENETVAIIAADHAVVAPPSVQHVIIVATPQPIVAASPENPVIVAPAEHSVVAPGAAKQRLSLPSPLMSAIVSSLP